MGRRMSEPITDPEIGGRMIRASLCVAGAAGAMTVFGSVYAMSVLNRPLMAAYGWQYWQAVLPFNAMVGALAIGCSAATAITRQYSARVAMVVCAGLFVSAMILAGSINQPSHLTRLIVACGIGGVASGIGYSVCVGSALSWWPRHQHVVAGICMAAFGLGSAVAAPIGRAAIEQLKSPDDLFYLWAVVATVVLSLGISTVSIRCQDRSRQISHSPIVLWRSGPFWFTAVALFGSTLCGLSLISCIADVLVAKAELDPLRAAYVISIAATAGVLGRLTLPVLSTYIGVENGLLAVVGTQSLLLLAFPLFNSWATIIWVACVYTIYGGGFGIVPLVLARHFPSDLFQRAYGRTLYAWSLGGIAGPLVFSFAQSKTNSINLGFSVIGVAALSCFCVALALVRRPT
jgi:MFS transporter, OFA family, oxalate/formate antiporter